ncbi:hypothetical protein PAXRUDRAFT_21954 [Paxillus rubicundulus Ve08.2h10]|uniref:Uncharacterized protein n=1 Tax=Paxillus rubicundulus Ve08.2h10 TaxID=930991 RepID=A0A0D0BLE6_9AGAM|nr:hypothetical protein PAXRUDRAFT_21954 [Paxillus rubicundulus Ve08.2h10]
MRRNGEAEKQRNRGRRKRTWSGVGSREAELTSEPVTPSNQAPSLGPGPLPSQKAKASVSKSRPKTPSVTQKAKFGIDVRVTPSESITIYHPLAGPPPQSIPWASALKLIATPVNPLLDPQPGPSLDPKDQIIKVLKVTLPACISLSPDIGTPSRDGQFPSTISFPCIGG